MTALANTDALTGLANRRRLLAVLDERIAQAEATGNVLSVILLDIDRFKRINDTSGHDAGDLVLQGVAEALRSAISPNDLLGRWGGEEFLVISPESTASETVDLAERCRTRLAETTFPGDGSVTASLGVSSLVPGEGSWPILRRADHAMYAAKAGGRDQVRGGEPPTIALTSQPSGRMTTRGHHRCEPRHVDCARHGAVT